MIKLYLELATVLVVLANPSLSPHGVAGCQLCCSVGGIHMDG